MPKVFLVGLVLEVEKAGELNFRLIIDFEFFNLCYLYRLGCLLSVYMLILFSLFRTKHDLEVLVFYCLGYYCVGFSLSSFIFCCNI